MRKKKSVRLALTGFMGVGKSSVARHLEHMTGCPRIDLDSLIEEKAQKTIAELIDSDGMERFREIESDTLKHVLSIADGCILSLGGGTWTIADNRELIRASGFTSVWLESTFEHCWYNIKFSRKERPLARDKQRARTLFDERQKVYCLADWHFIIRPGFNSYDIASQIADQVL
jgi:shikimate kinase